MNKHEIDRMVVNHDIDDMIANLDRERARFDAEVKFDFIFQSILAVVSIIIVSYCATGGH